MTFDHQIRPLGLNYKNGCKIWYKYEHVPYILSCHFSCHSIPYFLYLTIQFRFLPIHYVPFLSIPTPPFDCQKVLLKSEKAKLSIIKIWEFYTVVLWLFLVGQKYYYKKEMWPPATEFFSICFFNIQVGILLDIF